jgi:hypothetical protein
MPIKNWTPERTARARAQQAQWRKDNWSWLKVKRNSQRRKRYAHDPAYRRKCQLRALNYQQMNRNTFREAA